VEPAATNGFASLPPLADARLKLNVP
jgi:hypothetical protein